MSTPKKRKRSLVETLEAKIAVYNGNTYLFTLGVVSEFEKTDADYKRDAMHDAEMEYLLQKSQDLKGRLQAPRTTKTEIELPNIDLHELENDPAWFSFKKDTGGRCTFPAEENRAAWTKINNVANGSPILRERSGAKTA